MNHSVSTMSGKTKVKIVFLGNQSVGKSSIIQKYIHDRFDQNSNPTVGIDFLAKNISHGGKNYRMQLWDTAGQQRFRSLIPSYLKDAHCALITFDVTSGKTLDQASSWLNLYNQNRTGEGTAFLVGNKIDLEHRQVDTQTGKKKAQQLGVGYFEISAKSGQNIQQLFMSILQASTDVINGTSKSIPVQQNKIPASIKQQKEDETEVTKGKQQIDQTLKKIRQKNENDTSKRQNNENVSNNIEPVHNNNITLKASDNKQTNGQKNKSVKKGCC